MGLNKREVSNSINLTIIGRDFMQKSEEGHPDAKKREYEDKEGNLAYKYEIPYSSIDGIITGITFRESDFGESAIVNIDCDGTQVTVFMGTDSRHFSSLAKRLPQVDLTKSVTLKPYEVENENGKVNKGISVQQDGEKVSSFYWDAENKKSINGIPTVSKKEASGYDSDDWKMHFIKEKKFLKKEVAKLTFGKAASTKSGLTVKGSEDNTDGLPF